MKTEFRLLIPALSLTMLAAVTTQACALTVGSAETVFAPSVKPISTVGAGLRGCEHQAANSVTLSAVQLAQPRTGQRMARLPGLGSLVGSFEERRGERLVMGYPAGDKGTLWAEELRAWLVALGVPAKRIMLEPDPAHDDDSVTIAIQRQGEQVP